MEYGIPCEQIQNIMPITLFQKQILYSILINKSKNSYLEQVRYGIHGIIDIDNLIKAWEYTVAANDNLRTVFRWEGLPDPVQIVIKKKSVQCDIYNFSSQSSDERNCSVDHIVHEQWNKGVDLQNNPHRITFCLLDDSYCEMIIGIHHLLVDGWSNSLMLEQFLNYYDILMSKKKPLIKHSPSYTEFLKWQNKLDRNQALQFWKKYLSNIQTDQVFEKDEFVLENYGDYSLSLVEQSKNIEQYILQNQITLAAFIYGIWGLLLLALSKVNSQQFDLLFGITTSGRNLCYPNIYKISGFLIKTVPLRLKGSINQHISSFFQNILSNIATILEFSYMDLVEMNYHQLLQEKINCIIVIQNYPTEALTQNTNQKTKIKFISSQFKINTPMTIGCKIFEQKFAVNFTYDKSIISDSKMLLISNTIVQIIDIVLNHHDYSIAQLIANIDKKI